MSADPTSTDGDASPKGTENKTDSGDQVETVKRTDVGVSVSCKLKRGTGTRDQDEIRAKIKAETVEDAKADLEELKPYLREFAKDVRDIQPTVEEESA